MNITRVLLFTSNHEDYLEDSIVHGFKCLLGTNAIEYPVKNILYKDFQQKNKIRGGGFSLYALLDEKLKPSNQFHRRDITNNKFDLIVFASVHRTYHWYLEFKKELLATKTKMIFLDGEDNPAIFPYYGKYFRDLSFFSTFKPHKKYLYFKREITPETIHYLYLKLTPKFLIGTNLLPKNLKEMAFSIPAEKITQELPIKTKLFPKHIVDEEIAQKIGGELKYAFATEAEYYFDLQQSKFGITTKRSGWDCLRHYEIAANRAVICFKNLENKPQTCAPHGLIQNLNCISYNNYEDLMEKLKNINDEKYNQLQAASLEWIKNNTSIKRVQELLVTCNLNSEDLNN